jgi:hypothetical protein
VINDRLRSGNIAGFEPGAIGRIDDPRHVDDGIDTRHQRGQRIGLPECSGNPFDTGFRRLLRTGECTHLIPFGNGQLKQRLPHKTRAARNRERFYTHNRTI